MNGISRAFWAFLMDKLSYKTVYMTILIIQIIVGFTMELISGQKYIFLIWVATSYFCLGGHFSITPTILAKIYGHDVGGKVYGVFFLGLLPAGLICFGLSKFLYKSLGYGAILYILSGMSVVTLILLIFFKETPHSRKAL